MKFMVKVVLDDGTERKGTVDLEIPDNKVVNIPGFRSPIPKKTRHLLKQKVTETFGKPRSISISNC